MMRLNCKQLIIKFNQVLIKPTKKLNPFIKKLTVRALDQEQSQYCLIKTPSVKAIKNSSK